MPEWDDEGSEQEAVTRSFWSGTLTFGLVSIPVALYAANRARGVSLRMVGPGGTPLARRYFTSRDDRELDPDEIVRGYEVEKDRFVIVDDDELERLAPERTRDIDLRQFVKASEIDPMYFERAYYLTPTGSTKAYRLLAQVMEETDRAGIATFVMRTREYLVAILAENGILRAETLRFADELRSPADIGLPEPAKPAPAAVKKMDAAIGRQLESSLPRSELEDDSADRLRRVVQAKLRAGDDVVHGEKRDDDGPSDIIDLMEVLKRRLQGEQEDEAPSPARKPAAKKTTAKKTAARKPTAKKTASKTAARKGGSKTTASKTAASKTAASKTAAKKPAARKPAAKKATTKKSSSRKPTSKKAA